MEAKEILLGENVEIGKYVLLGIMPTKNKPVRKLQIGDNSIIRSHTVIYDGNKIGKNFQTGHGVMIRENNEIGDNVSIGTNSTVERDNKIGNQVRIHSNCFIPEFIEIYLGNLKNQVNSTSKIFEYKVFTSGPSK